MMRPVFLLPLLLAGCASSWPSGSYVNSISPADATVIASSISNYAAVNMARQDIHLVPAPGRNDPIATALAADLANEGIEQNAAGKPLVYVAAPMQGGVLLRISVGDSGASRFFARAANGQIYPAGPMTVMQAQP